MAIRWRLALLIPVFLIAASLIISSPRQTYAHGLVDQSNEGPTTGAAQILAAAPAGQEFKPSAPTLVAVDVHIEAFNTTGDDTLTVRIRQNTIAGAIVGSKSLLVAEAFTGWQHFDFPGTLTVVPGNIYVLELAATKATHGWTDSGNTYAGGSGIAGGNVVAGFDWFFRTYAEQPPANPLAVGGVVELFYDRGTTPAAAQSSSSDSPTLPLVAAVAAVAVAGLAASGWYYARRRLLG